MKSLQAGSNNDNDSKTFMVSTFPQPNPQNTITILRHRMAVQKALNMIEERIQDPPTLAELASFSGLSRTYLSFVFKEVTGIRLQDYLTQVRLEKAKDLLTNIDVKIKQVAHETGFSDPNYFCRSFKKKIGFSPTNWRVRQVRNLRNHDLTGVTTFEGFLKRDERGRP